MARSQLHNARVTAFLTAAVVALGVSLGLAGCATVARYDAADDIQALLASVRNSDRAAFEAHLDRPALKTQLRARLLDEVARAHGEGSFASFGAAMGAPLVDLAVDALVRPDVFRAEAQRLGYDPNAPLPPPLAIAALVRPLAADRACLSETHGGPCVFDFALRDGVWRLSGYEGPLGAPPAPKPPPRPPPTAR